MLFLQLSYRKLILTLIVFILIALFIKVFWEFYGTALCPLPPIDMQQPSFTEIRIDNTINAVGAILTDTFDRCSVIPDSSFDLAWKIVTSTSYILALIASYLLSCVIFSSKPKTKTPNKKK